MDKHAVRRIKKKNKITENSLKIQNSQTLCFNTFRLVAVVSCQLFVDVYSSNENVELNILPQLVSRLLWFVVKGGSSSSSSSSSFFLLFRLLILCYFFKTLFTCTTDLSELLEWVLSLLFL